VLYGVVPGYDSTSVCCLGKKGTKYNEKEGLEEGWDNIRAAVAGELICNSTFYGKMILINKNMNKNGNIQKMYF